MQTADRKCLTVCVGVIEWTTTTEKQRETSPCAFSSFQPTNSHSLASLSFQAVVASVWKHRPLMELQTVCSLPAVSHHPTDICSDSVLSISRSGLNCLSWSCIPKDPLVHSDACNAGCMHTRSTLTGEKIKSHLQWRSNYLLF